MPETPSLLQRFIESGRNTTAHPRLSRVRTLEEIRFGSVIWVIKGYDYKIIDGISTAGMENRGTSAATLMLDGGAVVKGSYDPQTRSLIPDSSGVCRIVSDKITKYDVDQGDVFCLLDHEPQKRPHSLRAILYHQT